jgi:alpha-glucosidase
MAVTVISPSVLRIRIVRENFLKDFSYAVVAKPEKTNFAIKEDDRSIVLQTDSLRLELIKKPVMHLKFYDHKGRLLNEDDPAFSTSWIGTEVTTYKKLQEGERFIGLGEKTGNLDRRGSAYVNWNNDYFGYPANADPLYQSIPFYIGIHQQLLYGIFLDNSYKTTFNFGASNNRFSYFSADDGEMNYYFIAGSTVPSIIKSYTSLTGRMEMPPLWSLGYQQCRWSYYPDKEVLSMAKTFRDKKIPADVIYLDVHYMDAYKVFTWHPERFSNPKKMIDELKAMGFHIVVIVDPGIKVEKGYEAYEDGLKNNCFVKYPDNTPYTGEVWPGWCHFPDFTDAKVREWWGKKFSSLTSAGVEGFWNDMNEPASWGNKTPELIQFSFEGDTSTHKRAHNVYGMQMSRGTFEGTSRLMGGRRSFILTRAGYAGIQRYSAVWTGDNVASDEHMLMGVRLVNSLGLSGVAFAGVDVGGFVGEADANLYARWMSIGAFTPFFRQHTMYGQKDKEPWTFGEEIENITRNSISYRYRLLPYIYSAFYEASQTGMPVSSTLVINYPFDPKIYSENFQNQYLFGPSLLVAPVLSTQKFAKVYLPEGTWYRLDTDERFEGGREYLTEAAIEKLPIFVKGGTVIPLQSQVQYATQKASDTLELHVYNGKKSESFVLYEDDGDSYEYKKEQYRKLTLLYDVVNKKIKFESAGKYESKFKVYRIVFHGFENFTEIKADGSKLTMGKDKSVVVGAGVKEVIWR